MRILYVTTISLTMNSFFKPHIQMLVDEGNQVDIACNFADLELDDLYRTLGCNIHQVDFSRSPLSVDNIKAYKQLNKVVEKGNYDIVHCHTPNASVITRLVCRKYRKTKGLKVFYTAHGFHFYKGAPILNWLIYYSVEKLCSRFTDKLITINQEDYQLAQNNFYAKDVCYVPGVGIDLSKFKNINLDRGKKRKEIGVPEDAFLLLSVGELNENKNHQIIIKALAKVKNNNVHYAVAGIGDKKEFLLELAKELKISEQVHLLGYRKDIPELNSISDVFCFPSIREGLGIAAIEAMASGLPLITTNIHGINDYSEDDVTGYKCSPYDIDGFTKAIEKMLCKESMISKFSENCKKSASKYDIENINQAIKKLY